MKNTLAQDARAAIPSVVQIQAQGYSEEDTRSILDPRYLAPATWAGSGFFIHLDEGNGYLLTNSHVVRNAKKLKILSLITSEELFDAEIIGLVTDLEPDIALIRLAHREIERFKKFSGGSIPHLDFADSSQIRRGEEIKAIGYPFGFSEPNISGGEISNLISGDVSTPERLVTDAAINFGNSGGPAIIKGGKVIGINTAIIVQANNIGFITPINYAKIVLPMLLKKKGTLLTDLGCRLQPNSEANAKYLGMDEAKGMIISHVFTRGLIQKAGLRRLDVILGINEYNFDRHGNVFPGDRVHKKNIFDVVRLIPLEEQITIRYYQPGVQKEVTIKAIPQPDSGLRFQPMVKKRKFLEFQGMIIQELNYEIMGALSAEMGIDYLLEISGKAPEISKLAITFIDTGSPADEVFFSVGDIIKNINGKKVRTLGGFVEAVRRTKTEVLIETQMGSFGVFQLTDQQKDQFKILWPRENDFVYNLRMEA
ncbi:MAG: trypsin-like peptidase domain-containing protein [Candidatus Brocadiaceae bacterium]|nr:trypsin-like peptidase domain-containing protein [Candidatus Brocadiaceae bacterium]